VELQRGDLLGLQIVESVLDLFSFFRFDVLTLILGIFSFKHRWFYWICSLIYAKLTGSGQNSLSNI